MRFALNKDGIKVDSLEQLDVSVLGEWEKFIVKKEEDKNVIAETSLSSDKHFLLNLK